MIVIDTRLGSLYIESVEVRVKLHRVGDNEYW